MVPAKPKELQHAVRRPCSGKELLLSPLTHSDEGKARVPTKANPLLLPACVPTVLFFTILDLSQEPGKQRLFPSSVLTRDGEGHQPRGRRKMTKREQARATFFQVCPGRGDPAASQPVHALVSRTVHFWADSGRGDRQSCDTSTR